MKQPRQASAPHQNVGPAKNHTPSSVQRVDPFIPVTRSSPRTPAQQPLRAPAQSFVHPREALPRNTPTSRPVHHITHQQPPPANVPQKAPSHPSKPQPKAKQSSGLKRIGGLILQGLLFLSLMIIGFMLQSIVMGQLAIFIYAVAAMILRIASRTTFLLALLAFGIVLISVVRSNTTAAGTFAVYAFLLLVVATISLGREVYNEG